MMLRIWWEGARKQCWHCTSGEVMCVLNIANLKLLCNLAFHPMLMEKMNALFTQTLEHKYS